MLEPMIEKGSKKARQTLKEQTKVLKKGPQRPREYSKVESLVPQTLRGQTMDLLKAPWTQRAHECPQYDFELVTWIVPKTAPLIWRDL